MHLSCDIKYDYSLFIKYINDDYSLYSTKTRKIWDKQNVEGEAKEKRAEKMSLVRKKMNFGENR